MHVILFVVLAALITLAACKDNDRRGDYDRDAPRQEQPFVGRIIDIPACGAGKAGYVTTRWPAPISGTMRLEYSITGTPDARIVGNENRDNQGRMHLHFQREGDDFSQSRLDLGYRQWSTAFSLLSPGDFVMEVPLVPDQWGNRAGFDAAMAKVKNVGFTLGDRDTKGHGVCMAAGTASIAIRAFTVQ